MENNTSSQPWALVTGASSGIGLRYARALAHDYHYNLVLVSNQETELNTLQQELITEAKVQALALCIDLSQLDAAEKVFDFCQTRQLNVEVLVNNAGVLIFQQLVEVPMRKLEVLVMLHVTTLTKMCRLFAPQMVERGKGYILNMSSMSAWMKMPGIQCYNATKGYVLSFSRSLWYEMRPHGVHVLAMTPGSTDTGLLPFGERFARLLRGVGITMPPERLVRRALRVLFSTWRKKCMPGAWNYIIVPIINHLPDWLVFWAMKKLWK